MALTVMVALTPLSGRIATSRQNFQEYFQDLNQSGNSLNPVERVVFSLVLANSDVSNPSDPFIHERLFIGISHDLDSAPSAPRNVHDDIVLQSDAAAVPEPGAYGVYGAALALMALVAARIFRI